MKQNSSLKIDYEKRLQYAEYNVEKYLKFMEDGKTNINAEI